MGLLSSTAAASAGTAAPVAEAAPGAISRAAAAPPAPAPVEKPPELDQTANYNTPLEPKQETAFQAWRTALPANLQNMQDYDLRGAWKADASAAANGHLPDNWKKPNHPTFSEESIYHGPYTPGGTWVQTGPKSKAAPEGVWQFNATQHNLKYRSADDLERYFATVEKGNKLVLPKAGK